MKQTSRIKHPTATRVRFPRSSAAGTTPQPAQTTERNSFEQFAEVSTSLVEHLPVHEFVQRTPHRLHPDEIPRFSDRVKRMADALQLTFVPAVNPLLGVIRVFPLPLLEWVYTTMAPQFKWPLLTDAQSVDDARRAQHLELRKRERAEASLQALAEGTDDVDMLTTIASLRESLRKEIAKLKGEIGEPNAPAPVTA